MKKKIIPILLLTVMILTLLPTMKPEGKAPAQDTTASDIRIMSANVYAEFPTWWGSFEPEDTSVRVVNLEKMLNENNPIAVCTQETTPKWYTAFEQLDTTKWAWLTEPDAAGYSYYNYVPNVGLALNSILYRKDLLTLNGSGVEPYTARTNGHCMVWGVFTVKSTGKQFVLISTHWTPDRPGDKSAERLLQAEQLAQKVNDLRLIYGDTVIVTGDFNCTDDSQEFRRFITNANAKDSRQWAKKRGDSLSKIDHIVTTSDASIDYHTVCYEANNAYKISDHPFVVADIKLTTNLYFDFTDTTDARQHYKQGAYRYNAFDYHTAYWKHDSSRVTGLTVNKSDGTLSFNVTESGNPYVFTDIKSATELKNAYGLNFPTGDAAHAYIRFRLTNSAQIDSSQNSSLTLSALNRSTGEMKSEKKNFNFTNANSGYVTIHYPLSATGIRSLGNIDSIQLSFDNIKNGSVKIAYIYIGVDNYSPLNYSMYFDFSNTAGDQSRYKGSAYGGLQFDKASQGYWATWETSTTSNTVYTDFAVDNTEGTLSVKVAQGMSYNNTNGKYGPWIATTKTYGSYPFPKATSVMPLAYSPGNAELIQIRFKTVDCELAAGSNPQVVVVYDYDSGSGSARGDYTMVADYTLKNDTYQILSIPLSDKFIAGKKITSLGFRFWHIKGTSANAKVVIDYIYVGPERGMPLHHVYDHKTVAPTCTAKGYTTHTCRTCAYSYQDSSTNATGHSYTYKATKNPSLSATGTLTGTCSKCSVTTTVTLPKLNTTDYTKTVVKASTCTEKGQEKYTWKTTTYGSFTFTISRNALGHNYTYAITTKPSLSATGVLTGTCSRCSEKPTVTLPKLNATDYAKTVDKAPTCTEKGQETYVWNTTTYGNFSITISRNALGHTSVADPAVAPTCTATGLTAGAHCSVCKVVLTPQTTVAATGHSYTYKATKNPTTSATGTLTGTCSACSGTTTVTLPKLTTTDYTKSTTKAPTCTATGTDKYTWKTTTYGTFSFNATTAKLGHKYDSGTVTTKPTFTSKGVLTYTCQNDSSHTTTEELAVLSKSLFFDFDNGPLAEERYNNYVYGFRNFDQVSAWKARTQGGKTGTVSMDTEAGTLTVMPSVTGFNSIYADTGSGVLSYDPDYAEYFQMRFKISGLTGSKAKATVYFYDEANTNNSATAISFDVSYLNSDEYVVITGEIKDAMKEMSEVKRMILHISGFDATTDTNAVLTFDYGFVGPYEELPNKESLFFDFTDTDADRLRYSSRSYGYLMYDDPEVRSWYYRTDRVADFSIDNNAGTMTLYSNPSLGATAWPSMYVETSMTYQSVTYPLSFHPQDAEYYQIRFKMKNLRTGEQLVKNDDGTQTEKAVAPYVRMAFAADGATSNTNGTGDFKGFDAYINSDTWIVVTLPLKAAFKTAKEIQKIRIEFGGIESISADRPGEITIDYAFIGKLEDLPTPAYTVTFKDAAGKTLATQLVNRGESAIYTGETPTKASDATNHYTFKGWDKALTNITADTTITATYTATAHSYTYAKLDTTNHTASCSCGYSKSEAHNYTYKATKNPTTSATGTLTGTCSKCSQTTTVTLPKLNTTDYTKTTTKAPTCTATGTDKYTWKKSDRSHVVL